MQSEVLWAICVDASYQHLEIQIQNSLLRARKEAGTTGVPVPQKRSKRIGSDTNAEFRD